MYSAQASGFGCVQTEKAIKISGKLNLKSWFSHFFLRVGRISCIYASVPWYPTSDKTPYVNYFSLKSARNTHEA